MKSIDQTLHEINKGYRPGLIRWLREHPDRWRRLLDFESRINEVTLMNDEVGLKCALSDYREFFEEMTALYVKGDTLFKRRERETLGGD